MKIAKKCLLCGSVFRANKKRKYCSSQCSEKRPQPKQQRWVMRNCCVCLYRVGFGTKRISKKLNGSIETVKVTLKRVGIYDPKRPEASIGRYRMNIFKAANGGVSRREIMKARALKRASAPKMTDEQKSACNRWVYTPIQGISLDYQA